MIHVLATLHTLPGKRAEFLAAFHELMPQVHAEDGCIEYGPAVDAPNTIAGIAPPRPDTVVVIEKWRDLAALEKHLAAPHMAAFKNTGGKLVAARELQVLTTA